MRSCERHGIGSCWRRRSPAARVRRAALRPPEPAYWPVPGLPAFAVHLCGHSRASKGSHLWAATRAYGRDAHARGVALRTRARRPPASATIAPVGGPFKSLCRVCEAPTLRATFHRRPLLAVGRARSSPSGRAALLRRHHVRLQPEIEIDQSVLHRAPDLQEGRPFALPPRLAEVRTLKPM